MRIKISVENKNLIIESGQTIVIGRAPNCDLVLKNRVVSSRHVRIAFDNNQWQITDLGSTNGTMVNNRQIAAKVPKPLVQVSGKCILGGPKDGSLLEYSLLDQGKSLAGNQVAPGQDTLANQTGNTSSSALIPTPAVSATHDNSDVSIVPGISATSVTSGVSAIPVTPAISAVSAKPVALVAQKPTNSPSGQSAFGTKPEAEAVAKTSISQLTVNQPVHHRGSMFIPVEWEEELVAQPLSGRQFPGLAPTGPIPLANLESNFGTNYPSDSIQSTNLSNPIEPIRDTANATLVDDQTRLFGQTPRQKIVLKPSKPQPAIPSQSGRKREGITDNIDLGLTRAGINIPQTQYVSATGWRQKDYSGSENKRPKGKASVYKNRMEMQQDQVIPIPNLGQRITIGRAPDNQIVLPDPIVSGHHAVITNTTNGLLIEDLGSLNGVFVNGTRVQNATVKPGDIVLLGKIALRHDGTHLAPVGRNQNAVASVVIDNMSFEVAASAIERTKTGKKTKRLLDEISLVIPKNSLLAVIGPSGAGKTTLLRCMLGKQAPHSGATYFDGLEIRQYAPALTDRIGMVPQDDLVHPELTGLQALKYTANLRFPDDASKKDKEAAIKRVVNQLGLSQNAGTKIASMSGGQRKRVSTAMELLAEPDLLFLDEPTSGLDPNLDREVMLLLRDLAHGDEQSEGRTVVVITHSTANLNQADNVLLLAPGGKVAYFGPPNELQDFFKPVCEPWFADIYDWVATNPDLAKERFQRSCFSQEKAVAAALASMGVAVSNSPASGEKNGVQTPVGEVLAEANYATGTNTVLTHNVRSNQVANIGMPGSMALQVGNVASSVQGKKVVKAPKRSLFKQVRTLSARQIRLMMADPLFLGFTLVLPLVMALITLMIPGSHGFIGGESSDDLAKVKSLLVVLIFGATLMGVVPAIRELVREREIYRRECAVGLRSGAYLFSKILTLGGAGVVQSVILTLGLTLMHKHAAGHGVIFGFYIELMLTCLLATLSASALGLLISACVKTSEQAMPFMILVLITQLVMCGGMIDFRPGSVGHFISNGISAQWAYSAAAQTVNLNESKDRVGRDRRKQAANEAAKKERDAKTKVQNLTDQAQEQAQIAQTQQQRAQETIQDLMSKLRSCQGTINQGKKMIRDEQKRQEEEKKKQQQPAPAPNPNNNNKPASFQVQPGTEPLLKAVRVAMKTTPTLPTVGQCSGLSKSSSLPAVADKNKSEKVEKSGEWMNPRWKPQRERWLRQILYLSGFYVVLSSATMLPLFASRR